MDEHQTGQKPVAEEETMRQAGSETHVISRVPDLDGSPTDGDPRSDAAGSHGRILSPSMSLKLLAGGAVLLILAAVIPWVLDRDQAPRDQRPAPNAAPAPLFVDESAQAPGTENPKAKPPAPVVVQQAPPNLSFNPQIPTGPDFTSPAARPGNNIPATPKADAQQVTPGQPELGQRGLDKQANSRWATPGGQIVHRPPAMVSPFTRQSRQLLPAADPTQVPRISSRPQDTRLDNRGQRPVPVGQGPATGAGLPLPNRGNLQQAPVDGRPGVYRPEYRTNPAPTTHRTQPAGPGVARFDDTIMSTPVR